GDGKLAGVGSGESGMHIQFGIESGADGDHVGMNVENIRDNLRGCGLVSLPLRAGTDRDDDFAVNIELAVRALRIAGERSVGVDDLRASEVVGAGINRIADATTDESACCSSGGLLVSPAVPSDRALCY